MPPAAEPFGWLVQRDGQAVFAFVPGGGPIVGPLTGAPPLTVHPALRGKILIAGGEHVLPHVEQAETADALCAALEAAGYKVLRTPTAAMGWALGGLLS